MKGFQLHELGKQEQRTMKDRRHDCHQAISGDLRNEEALARYTAHLKAFSDSIYPVLDCVVSTLYQMPQ